MMTYDSSYSGKSEILWAWEVIYWIWMMDEPWAYPEVMLIWLTLLPSGERKMFVVDHVDTVNWFETMNLLVICQWWNQQKTYLVSGREYVTSFAVEWMTTNLWVGRFYPTVVVFDVQRSGLRFFDWSRLSSTWLDPFFLPEPVPHWLESIFDSVTNLKVSLHIIWFGWCCTFWWSLTLVEPLES